MTFSELSTRSINNSRILVEINITQENTQWVNIGAGIWYVNAEAIYSYVDSTLLEGFTIQTISDVGSVAVDNILLLETNSLLDCSETAESFYWDSVNNSLYVHFPDNDEPFIHNINLGIVCGLSREGFQPLNSNTFYESRLIGVPTLNQSRDPLFFGKIQYEGGSIKANNADGYFDTLVEDNYLYGNIAKIYYGFEELDINDYVEIFTGLIENVTIDEEYATFSIIDKRKRLTKKITYSCTNLNALEAIEEVLEQSYGWVYNSLYYDTTQWELMKAIAPVITIDMQSEDTTISIIEMICNSIWGIFIIKADGRFSFKIPRIGNYGLVDIPCDDILNHISINYDPSEVITSTKIGYNKNWVDESYTYLNDTSQESAIYKKYKIYNEKTFDTILPTLELAQDLSDDILDYSGEVRGGFDIQTSMQYYYLDICDFAYIEICRTNSDWLGLRKIEILNKSYDLINGIITFNVRKYGGELDNRVTTDGDYRATSYDDYRRAGA